MVKFTLDITNPLNWKSLGLQTNKQTNKEKIMYKKQQ